MDDFVCNKLTEWGLSNLIERFRDEGIDKESLECLEDKEIDNLITKLGPRAKFKRRLKLLKGQHEHEAAQAGPSTSNLSDKEKRRLDPDVDSSNTQSPTKKRQCDVMGSNTEEQMLITGVKSIMRCVYERLHFEDNTKFNAFLKNKICELEIDKRELIGVFGKTGAGKSSLINAIIGERNLLPSGSVSACTSVMIKVEANKNNSKYEAEIEFITEEEWKDELWSLSTILRNEEELNEDEDYLNIVNKLTAVYGEEWRNISPENLMDNKYFREIPEFLKYKRKFLTCESAKELSAKFVRYTRSDSSEEEGREVRRWYWPLVKCVTVRVPNNPLLQHVTLVDLPGSGDRNKSRDKMWKGLVGSCSTVWIVTEINRAASEKEPWEILESACSLIGNGGQCQQIHFICTKSDLYENWADLSANALRDHILRRNVKAKEEVHKELRKLNSIRKHFSDQCLEVFTVSSTEFLKQKHLQQEETEIPKLQEFLQNLNECHSETLNYVSGAYGILSLMQGASCRDVAESKADVCAQLEDQLRHELHNIRRSMRETYEAFKLCLTEGVQISIDTCEKKMHSFLNPRQKRQGFHRTLRCAVENNGVHKPKKRKLINLNEMLSSSLTDSIDETFRKTFPNEGKCEPLNGVISTCSLKTESLIEKYSDVKLQLIFLKTEEEKIKTKLKKMIRERKKTVYSSLTGTVEEAMQDGYKKAADFRGQDTLKNMRETLEKHVHNSKNNTFEMAKTVMLDQLRKLMEDIIETLEQTLNEAIELSLKTDDLIIPDFSTELDLVTQYYSELEGSPDTD